MKSKWLFICGMLAPILYIGAVILGGLMNPSYSHMSEQIEALTAAGAPNKALLDILFLAASLLVIAFGAGIFRLALIASQGKTNEILAAIALTATGLCGVLLHLFLIQSPDGTQANVATTETLRSLVVGVATFTSLATLLTSILWLRQQTKLNPFIYVPYTLVTLGIVLFAGVFGSEVSASGFELFKLVNFLMLGIGSVIVLPFVLILTIIMMATNGAGLELAGVASELFSAAKPQPEQTKAHPAVIYILVTSLVVLGAALLGRQAAHDGFALVGMVERIIIGAMMIWIFVIALSLYITTRADETSVKSTDLFHSTVSD